MEAATNNEVINIATVGHVDHGKTTVIAALVSILEGEGMVHASSVAELSAAAPVTEWGMSFRRTVVEYGTRRRAYANIDCPGHMDFVKSLVGGAYPLDAALLVVSAADGPMVHTRDQLLMLRRLDVPVAAVFLNKVDAVAEPELVAQVEKEVRDLLDECGFDGERTEFVRGSALLALQDPGNRDAVAPLETLIDVLDEMIPLKVSKTERPFLLSVENVWHDDEKGAVGSGTVERGAVRPGDRVVHAGMKESAEIVVTGIEKAGRPLEKASTGDSVDLFLRDTERERLQRGMVLAAPRSVETSNRFRAIAYLLDRNEGGRPERTPADWSPGFLVRSAEVDGAVALPEGTESIEPGGHAEMNIELGIPVALETKLRFGIKETGRTVGAGVITEVVH